MMLLSAQALPQDADNQSRDGKLAFNNSCRTCHSMDDGDNRLGPNLHGIMGRQAGSEEYGYSPALKSSDIVWDAQTLDRFIENPEAVIPGNNMKPYGGISDPEVRESIVSHLSNAGPEAADEGD
jgi:cytochrome c